jgi:hypothetical protein
VHCKNKEALLFMSKEKLACEYFWHQEDDYTLTSNRHIWTYPGKDICNRTIIVALTKYEVDDAIEKNPYGICTDYPRYAKTLIEQKQIEKQYATYIEICMMEDIIPESYQVFQESIRLGKCQYCMTLNDTECACKNK